MLQTFPLLLTHYTTPATVTVQTVPENHGSKVIVYNYGEQG